MPKFNPQKFKDEAPELNFLMLVYVIDELMTLAVRNDPGFSLYPEHELQELKKYYPSLHIWNHKRRNDFKMKCLHSLMLLHEQGYIKVILGKSEKVKQHL